LGAPYTALINRWIELERLNNWQTVTTGLTNVNRPREVSAWIRNGRRKNVIISSDQIEAFGKNVWAWWLVLQLSWRDTSEGKPLHAVACYGDNWNTLDHFGKNGWLSLLACLKWW
ncbi:hypothetical protein GYMLUDRAFT_115058, partial [Collybiopsis luxurians FD-317 M1]